MSLTVQNLITDALEEIMAVPAGDTPSNQDLTKGLSVLIRMVDASNINRGNIASLRVDTRTLVAGTQRYTIGPSGSTFTAVAPIRIERANILMASGSNTVRRKLNLLDDYQWAAKKFLSASGIPFDLYNDGGQPTSAFSFYPIPASAYQFETYTWQQFSQSALADVLAIPPGYFEFWMYGLAIRLAGVFGKDPRATTIDLFSEARAAVQAFNCPSPRISSNGDTPSSGGGGMYNWISGTLDND